MTDTHPSTWRRLVGEAWQLQVAILAGVLLLLGWITWFGAERFAWPHGLLVTGKVLVWSSLVLGSIHGVQAAWASLKRLRPDIDVLMVVGAYLSAAIGHVGEGALLLFMFTLAGALEHRAMARARDAVSRLQKLMPRDALRREGDEWEPVPAESLRPGDRVLVRPGESIPADGTVVTGRSSVDQSTLTGESLPRTVVENDAVFAGTMNINGAIEVRVTRPVAESSIQRILTLVLEAQETRQPVQRVIDRLSTPYTVVVFIAAALVLLFELFVRDSALSTAALRSITLLVVASPCALVIATPTATLCGLSRAARAGVLIKGGDALERLASVREVALDKTGTLTTGRIEVVRVVPIGPSDVDALLRVAMAAEQRSTHPIAEAIVRLARSHRLHPADLATLTNVPGRGVEGTMNQEPIRIGTFKFCEPLIPVCFRNHTKQIVDGVRNDGGMPVVVAWRGESVVLGVADTPRAGAAELADRLRDVGVERVTMLTGDHATVATRVAAELGIENVRAGLLPEQKVEEIRRLRESGADRGRHGLAMIGDGVNDAPALAVADVGLAMGAIGADAALETADVVLLHDDLGRVPWSIALARSARRIMIANLAFAIAVIATLATITLLGALPLGLGVVGHEGSTLLVVANSLRLLAFRGPGSLTRTDAESEAGAGASLNATEVEPAPALSSGDAEEGGVGGDGARPAVPETAAKATAGLG